MTRWVALFFLLSCVGTVPAQEVTVSIGSVTKYSGIVTNKSDVADVKSINNSLNTLESQVAKAFIEHSEVDYLDRMHTDALFSEIHFSSDAAFNPNSGALRNLLGRLDFLVVMDASEVSSARIRLIDVETGAVKAIGTCTKHWSLGIGEPTPPDCIAPFVEKSVAAAKAKRQIKIERLKQKADALHAAENRAAKEAAEAKAEKQQRERADAAAQSKAAAEAAEEARQNAAKQAEEAKRQAEIDRQLADLKPTLDDLSTRLKPHLAFWHNMSLQLAASGQSLRSSVQSLLEKGKADNADCHNLFVERDVTGLQACLASLHKDVEKLDELRD
jgi:hypothetical protein